MPNVLVVDDETQRTEYLKRELKGTSEDAYNIEQVTCWDELLLKLRREYQRLNLVIFDVDFSHLSEAKLLRSTQDENDISYQGYLMLKAMREWETNFWQQQGESPPFIKAILTSAIVPSIAGRESDIEAYGAETYWYAEDSPEYEGLVNQILHLCPPIDKERISNWRRFGIVTGNSRKMYELMCYAEEIAKQNCHVWIDGPTGSGKELMARFIHQKSHRATNLSAMLSNLLDELEQLNYLGPAVFGQKIKTIQQKINADLANSVPRFKPLETKAESKQTINQISHELRDILTTAGSDGNTIDQILQEVQPAGAAEDDKPWKARFKNQEYYVALCLLQMAQLWRESQQKEDASRGLFNFVALNCATFPDEKDLLMTLFGFPSGTYTDVEVGKPGVLKAVSYMRGTLFLDEIADLSPQAQADLLRVVQEGELRRLNSNIPESANIRVVTATNKNIYELVRQGRFRHDLFMRLMQARLEVPPLMQRMDDFDELAHFFLERKRQEYRQQGKPFELQFDANALLFLQNIGKPWDGNIRALRNVVERAYETAAIEGYEIIDLGHVRRTLDILRKVKLPKDDEPKTASETDRMSIDKIKTFLSDAFDQLDIQENTFSNLQDLEEHIKNCAFQKAVAYVIKIHHGKPLLNKRYASIAEILHIDRKRLNNTQWMKEKVDKCLTEAFLPKENEC